MASEAMEQGQGADQLQERERVIRKIKRCLALGQSSNPNEAETALRQAQAMMDKYRLSEVDVALSEVGETTVNAGTTRMADWHRGLASVSAKAFRCRVILRRRVGTEVGLTFVGVMPAAELAAYAYDSLYAQLMLAKERYRKERPGSGRAAVNDFCMAWVLAVNEKIKAFSQANATEVGTENALIVIQQKESQAIDLWIKHSLGKVRASKIKGRAMDQHAAAMGDAAGSKARLNTAMHGRKDGPLARAAA